MLQLFEKTALLDGSQRNSLCSLLRVNKNNINFGKQEEVLRVKFHLLRFNVLEITHLHGEAFQEVEAIISPRII